MKKKKMMKNGLIGRIVFGFDNSKLLTHIRWFGFIIQRAFVFVVSIDW